MQKGALILHYHEKKNKILKLFKIKVLSIVR